MGSQERDSVPRISVVAWIQGARRPVSQSRISSAGRPERWLFHVKQGGLRYWPGIGGLGARQTGDGGDRSTRLAVDVSAGAGCGAWQDRFPDRFT